jgi:hypothetical protein
MFEYTNVLITHIFVGRLTLKIRCSEILIMGLLLALTLKSLEEKWSVMEDL